MLTGIFEEKIDALENQVARLKAELASRQLPDQKELRDGGYNHCPNLFRIAHKALKECDQDLAACDDEDRIRFIVSTCVVDALRREGFLFPSHRPTSEGDRG